MSSLTRLLAAGPLAVLVLLPACSNSSAPQAEVQPTGGAASSASATHEAAAATPPADALPDELPEAAAAPPLRVAELLDLCFSAASRFPLDPHIKNRSRAQELVVQAAFEQGDPERALGYANKIENWRRGACYADYAYHLASDGDSPQVQEYLQKAEQFVDPEDDWRTQTIVAKIARVHQRLGNGTAAAAMAAGVLPAERAELEAERSKTLPAERLDAQLEWVETSTAAGTLDDVKLAFASLEVLYGRFYGDAARREAIEAAVRAARGKAPLDITLATLSSFAFSALAQGDQGHAAELAAEVGELIETVEWLPENRVAVSAAHAKLRSLAGDPQGALLELGSLRKLYERKREVIYDIYRADALVPLAEAYHAVGEEPTALELYAMALEEGVQNPNSRPRVDDLIQVALSLVREKVAPSDALMERMREIEAGLGDPW